MSFTVKQMLEKATEFIPFNNANLLIKQKCFNKTPFWVVETDSGERITSSLDEIPNDPFIKSSNRNITYFKTIELAFNVAEAYRNKKLGE